VKRKSTIKEQAGQMEVQAEKSFYTRSQPSTFKLCPLTTEQKNAKTESLLFSKKILDGYVILLNRASIMWLSRK